MSDVIHDSFVIARAYPARPAAVFRAFADPARKRRWYVDGGHATPEAYELDFREGGRERAETRLGDDTPFPGVAMIAESVHLDIRPDQRIVMAQTMTIGERRISAALITFEIRPADAGSELVMTHQAAFFEGADGPAMRRGGWEALLDGLGMALSPDAA
ncbi:MAG: polyketide cyclase [Phenylobacterium sp.]|uniref:SRPBCC domain-containing protein n=1 Tax=Phenylobacterium sp. TaxID=1871053 RepID=UPI0025E15F3D|nr:SRPBCC domain-containing protein [Phenylobacterium sp.]MBI1198901.1 polyketide cyclase [Phenylobacterium sp.]